MFENEVFSLLEINYLFPNNFYTVHYIHQGVPSLQSLALVIFNFSRSKPLFQNIVSEPFYITFFNLQSQYARQRSKSWSSESEQPNRYTLSSSSPRSRSPLVSKSLLSIYFLVSNPTLVQQIFIILFCAELRKHYMWYRSCNNCSKCNYFMKNTTYAFLLAHSMRRLK